MWEFFKRALQLYRVPLTPEGEELLRVHRNETKGARARVGKRNSSFYNY